MFYNYNSSACFSSSDLLLDGISTPCFSLLPVLFSFISISYCFSSSFDSSSWFSWFEVSDCVELVSLNDSGSCFSSSTSVWTGAFSSSN